MSVLQRQTFETSRLAEFFSEKELRNQIGYPKELWPLALLKELIDNALDECETAGVAPVVDVDAEADVLTVRDNGRGIPESTLVRSLDYLVRVSDKNYYVSPTRGQLGNALKCVWAAPYVATGGGWIEVGARGKRHRITVSFDPIAQEPRIDHDVRADPKVRRGTVVRVNWPGIARCLAEPATDDFYKGADLVAAFAAFNPHATLSWCGRRYAALKVGWNKWQPSDPTSAHWYDGEALRNLIAAYLQLERRGKEPRTVRELIAEFRGLSGTAKQKTIAGKVGLTGASLAEMVVDGHLDDSRITALLEAMQADARAVKPAALGVIGEDALKAHLVEHWNVDPESFRYKRVLGTSQRPGRALPYVWEVAFALYTEETARGRIVMTGLNWSPALRSPIQQLTQLLGLQRIGRYDPVLVFVHLACPVLPFVDRGKSVLELLDGKAVVDANAR